MYYKCEKCDCMGAFGLVPKGDVVEIECDNCAAVYVIRGGEVVRVR